MNQDKIKKLINEIETTCKLLKSELSGVSVPPDDNASSSNEAKLKKGPGPAKPMTELIKSGFLDKPKTVKEVVAELKKRTHNFKPDRVSLVLIRLVRKGRLRRDGDGSQVRPWKYSKK